MKKDNLPLIFNGLKVDIIGTQKEGIFVSCAKLQTKKMEISMYYKKISNFIKND